MHAYSAGSFGHIITSEIHVVVLEREAAHPAKSYERLNTNVRRRSCLSAELLAGDGNQ